MAVPFSPRELAGKIQAIYHHKSQRSQSSVEAGLYEAWQQAEHCNRSLAHVYDQLGLAEYEAIEAFRRYALKGPPSP
jgi:glucosamine-6-phosphate deaminase